MRCHCLWAALVLLGSCSSPRYTYYFDHQYPVLRKESLPNVPLLIQPSEPLEFTASTTPILKNLPTGKSVSFQTPPSRHQINSGHVVSAQKITTVASAKGSTKKIDADIKRSIIFIAAGVVALIIGTQVFWVLGSLSLLIGIIFGIKWLLRN